MMRNKKNQVVVSQIKSKRVALACMLCAALLVFTACTDSGVPLRGESGSALPEVAVAEVAPIGDAMLEFTQDATFYLPRFDGSSLVSLTASVNCSAARLDTESIIRSLLNHTGNGVASAMGGDVKLSLYGANPVEISGDVATVNLAASALQLSRKELYICGQAIANTLTELGNIHYVNILVMDRPMGLDIGSTLPAGSLTRSMVSDIGAIFEQKLSQRVEAGDDPVEKKLSATVTLYFPLSDINGMMAEARNITFPSQRPSDMVIKILDELSEGSVMVAGSPTLPLLSGLLVETPRVEEPENGDGKMITLHFDASLDDMLRTMGVSRASCLGAIAYSLSTFIPNVTGVETYIGDERVEHVMLGATSGIMFENGIQRRANYASLLMDECTLYFANSDNTALVRVQRPIPYYQRTNPRALLLELFQGPSEEDSVTKTNQVLPEGLLSDADILGVSLQNKTLAINLSDLFIQAGEGITSQQDRLLAYAMVNTLLCDERATKICFFVNGNPLDAFTGEVYWSGYFYRNEGLVHAK